jgi:hypothetical protein
VDQLHLARRSAGRRDLGSLALAAHSHGLQVSRLSAAWPAVDRALLGRFRGRAGLRRVPIRQHPAGSVSARPQRPDDGLNRLPGLQAVQPRLFLRGWHQWHSDTSSDHPPPPARPRLAEQGQFLELSSGGRGSGEEKTVCMLFTRLADRSSIRSGGEKELGEQENTKMARKSCRALASTEHTLTCLRTHCGCCDHPMAVAYRTQRTITTLQGSCRLILRVRRCRNPACTWYHRSFRPEEEGHWALPHGEFGLDVIALVGSLRYTAHRSIPEIHRELHERGVSIAERTVTHLLQRYEELVALHLTDLARLRERFKEQGQGDPGAGWVTTRCGPRSAVGRA